GPEWQEGGGRSPRRRPPDTIRRTDLEAPGQLHAVHARPVDEGRQVVEVDGADDVGLVRNVADIDGRLQTPVQVAPACAQTAFEVGVLTELDRLIEEEVEVLLHHPVGRGEQL